MVVLMLCSNSMAPSTCKDDISASGICLSLEAYLFVYCYIGRPL